METFTDNMFSPVFNFTLNFNGDDDQCNYFFNENELKWPPILQEMCGTSDIKKEECLVSSPPKKKRLVRNENKDEEDSIDCKIWKLEKDPVIRKRLRNRLSAKKSRAAKGATLEKAILDKENMEKRLVELEEENLQLKKHIMELMSNKQIPDFF